MDKLNSLDSNVTGELRPASVPRRAVRRILCWGVVAALGLLQVCAHHRVMNPDGISYLEIARAGISGWHGFVNAYWSPLYPFLLSLVFRVFQPSLYWEFTAAHLLNFGIYLGAYFCVEFLVEEFLLARQVSSTHAERKFLLSEEDFRWIGFVIFLWASRYWLGTALVSPDLLVAAIFCLATAILLRIRRGIASWITFASLGVVLGIGYLAKAPMFLLGFVFVVAAYLLLRGRPQALVRAGVALLAFLCVAAPFVAALSYNKQRLTFSDTSTISYAEYVNQMQLFVHWHGEIPGSGTPVHPTRRVLADPPLFEFAAPVPGSYPPWYDPSYWYEGVRAHFSLKGEFWAIFRGANEYLKMFSRSGALWGILVALVWATRGGGGLERGGAPWWPVLLPGWAALAMYSLVHAETRFVSGVGLVFLLWILAAVQTSSSVNRQNVFWAKLVVFLVPAIAIAWNAASDANRLVKPEPFVAWDAAQALHGAGIPVGSKVAYIGPGLEAHWAHLAQVQIIAEIPDPGWRIFAALDGEKKHEVLKKFAEAGALAVVTKHEEVTRGDSAWQRLGTTKDFVVLLPRAEPSPARGIGVIH